MVGARIKRRFVIWLLWVVCFVLCFVLGAVLASGLLVALQAAGAPWSVETTVGNLVFRLVTYVFMAGLFAGVPLLLLKRNVLTLEQMGLGRMLRFGDIGLALAGVIVYLLITFFTQYALRFVPGFDGSQTQDLGISTQLFGSDLLIAYIVLVILTPLFEELIFRGMLYAELRKSQVNQWAAALVVSVLFGVAHGQWNVGVDVFCMSMVACYLREMTGTIWPGVVLHILKNAVAFWFVFIAAQSMAG